MLYFLKLPIICLLLSTMLCFAATTSKADSSAPNLLAGSAEQVKKFFHNLSIIGIIPDAECDHFAAPQTNNDNSIAAEIRNGPSFLEIESTENQTLSDPMLVQVLRESGLVNQNLTTHATAKTPFVLHYGGANNLSSRYRSVFRRATMQIRYEQNKLLAQIYGWDLNQYENYNSTPEFHAIINPETNEPVGILTQTYVCMQESNGVTNVETIDGPQFENQHEQCAQGNIVRINQVFSYSYNQTRRSLEVTPLRAGISIQNNSQGTNEVMVDQDLQTIIRNRNVTLSPLMEAALSLREYVCDEQYRPRNNSFSRGAQLECGQTDPDQRREYFRQKRILDGEE